MEKQLYNLSIAVKERRVSLGFGLRELADKAQVSKSLLSKIENHRSIPSLPVLLRIAQGLQTNLSDLSAGIETDNADEYVLIRKNERKKEVRENAVGFRYQSLIMRFIHNILFEASIVTLSRDAKRKAVSSDGSELLYILRGTIEFRLGQERILLEPGDALFFEGRIPHVPRNVGRESAEYFVAYLIEQSNEG